MGASREMRLVGHTGTWRLTKKTVGVPGAFSSVVVGINEDTFEKVAVKIIDMKSDACARHSKAEVEMLEVLAAQKASCNFVRVYECFEIGSLRYIVMKLYDCDLFDYTEDMGMISEAVSRRLFRSICVAVGQMHGLGYCHLDLKLENILVCRKTLELSLSDFGFSRRNNVLHTKFDGSLHYAAPEIVANKPYDGFKADVWSLGVLLFAMLTECFPVDHNDEQTILRRLRDFDVAGVDFSGLTPGATELLKGIFNPDPVARWNLDDVLAHPWLQLTRPVQAR